MSDITTNHDLLLNSEIPTNELADGELDERDLEGINGGDMGDEAGKLFKNIGNFLGDLSQAPRKAGRALLDGIREARRN